MNTTFAYPNFRAISEEDGPTHEVRIVEFKVGDRVFTAKLIRSRRVAPEGYFLVANIRGADPNGKKLWEFPHARRSHQLGVLVQTSADEVVVAFISKDSRKVEEVMPLSPLPEQPRLEIRRAIGLKLEAGERLGLKCEFDPFEQTVARVVTERREAEETECRRQREERVERIRNRKSMTAYTANGERRWGTPVIEAEWPSLVHGAWAILVASYNEESGGCGEPLEAFRVDKRSGRAAQKIQWVGPLAGWNQPPQEDEIQPAGPTPLDLLLIPIGEEFYGASLYESMDEIRAARKAGLNSGTYVTAKDHRDEEGLYEIFRVYGKKIETLGFFPAMQVPAQ
jgi:hypothetical protein